MVDARIEDVRNGDLSEIGQTSTIGLTRPAERGDKCSLVFVDKRALNRECFVRVLRDYGPDLEILAFDTLDDWKKVRDSHGPAGAVLVSVGGSQLGDAGFLDWLRKTTEEMRDIPVVVLSDSDDLSNMVEVIDCGARGYIPTSLGMAVCLESIRLAMVGGTFLPASAVMSMRDRFRTRSEEDNPMAGLFTQRQAEVAQALRRGKANKIIAYELNLRESTVKVHIRNIMKKLNATNRTEVAFKINQLMEKGGSALQ
ncbi:response regulator transcription factor [Oricola thermophila]|uniref:Response regulator transcription factor n=1 Tax=Oricola thermophila TaxID=2742145 RepID=A0A6N1VFC8_9HYPH|nr:response regulator transcription factor [Oricola thermophila]QKV17942.1 response regulator transcription factor [Oricola thermophila]